MSGRRRRLGAPVTAAVLVTGLLLHGGGATGAVDTADAEAVAARWVEVHEQRLEDCSVLELFTADYLEDHGHSVEECEDDPTYFDLLFQEAETAGSHYLLGEVSVDGDEAVAEVREEGGKVPELRLLLVRDGEDWLIEAVGAETS